MVDQNQVAKKMNSTNIQKTEETSGEIVIKNVIVISVSKPWSKKIGVTISAILGNPDGSFKDGQSPISLFLKGQENVDLAKDLTALSKIDVVAEANTFGGNLGLFVTGIRKG